jgi:hypothetical protein
MGKFAYGGRVPERKGEGSHLSEQDPFFTAWSFLRHQRESISGTQKKERVTVNQSSHTTIGFY